jgi:hypothetical protein
MPTRSTSRVASTSRALVLTEARETSSRRAISSSESGRSATISSPSSRPPMRGRPNSSKYSPSRSMNCSMLSRVPSSLCIVPSPNEFTPIGSFSQD